jgi:Anthrone oxygenase
MEWQPAYKRGAIMQATISLLSTALGASAWWQTANIGFGIGAILALLPWPWTLLVIKPTNDKLLATSPEVAGAESRRLLVTWGNLHTIRVALGGAATIAFLIGLIQQYSTQ